MTGGGITGAISQEMIPCTFMLAFNHFQGPIIPPEKLVSPVAEALRQVLSRFSWALQGGALLPPPAPPTVPEDDVAVADTPFGPTLTSTPYSTPSRSMHLRPTADGGPQGRDFTDTATSGGDHVQGDYRCEWVVSSVFLCMYVVGAVERVVRWVREGERMSRQGT